MCRSGRTDRSGIFGMHSVASLHASVPGSICGVDDFCSNRCMVCPDRSTFIASCCYSLRLVARYSSISPLLSTFGDPPSPTEREPERSDAEKSPWSRVEGELELEPPEPVRRIRATFVLCSGCRYEGGAILQWEYDKSTKLRIVPG